MFKRLAIAAACIATMSSTAMADTLQWQLQGVSFNDGSFLNGGFSTDSTTGALIDFDVKSSDGSLLTGFHYAADSAHGGPAPFASIGYQFQQFGSGRYIQLAFDQWLSSPGQYQIKLDGSSYECNNCAIYRTIVTGSVVAVPEPETYVLMLGGLGLMAWVARRRQAAQA